MVCREMEMEAPHCPQIMEEEGENERKNHSQGHCHVTFVGRTEEKSTMEEGIFFSSDKKAANKTTEPSHRKGREEGPEDRG